MADVNNNQQSQILYTIITVTFNAEHLLEKTVLSIVRQLDKNVEFIVIDGGSTDQTVDMLKKYENHIDYWISEPDTGIYNAMNKGIQHATGQYICFINAGDILLALPNLDNDSNNDLVASSVAFREGGVKLPSPRYLTLQNTLHHQGLLYRKTIFDQIGLYDESFRILGDYELNLRALRNKFKIVTLNHTMTEVDLTGISSQGAFSGYREEILARYKNMNPLMASALIIFSLTKFILKQTKVTKKLLTKSK